MKSESGQTALHFEEEPKESASSELLKLNQDQRSVLTDLINQHYEPAGPYNGGYCKTCGMLQQYSVGNTCVECDHQTVEPLGSDSFGDDTLFHRVVAKNPELVEIWQNRQVDPESDDWINPAA